MHELARFQEVVPGYIVYFIHIILKVKKSHVVYFNSLLLGVIVSTWEEASVKRFQADSLYKWGGE